MDNAPPDDETPAELIDVLSAERLLAMQRVAGNVAVTNFLRNAQQSRDRGETPT